MTLPPRSRLLRGVSLLALIGLLLSGCASTISLRPAAAANNPGCAAITVRLPQNIDDLARRHTNAQGTAAWGDPATILLRCGVTPIGPTTKPCVTVNNVDWVLATDPSAQVSVYLTFGRIPETELIIDHSHGLSDASVLPAMASAISAVHQTARCE